MSNSDKDQKKNLHKGHRQKVKKRFLEAGLNGMAEHNILEFLLFFGIPYRDTNDIAHNLMEYFGSFSKVLEASHSDLLKVEGMTDNAAYLITLLLPVFRRYTEDIEDGKLKFEGVDEAVRFLRKLYIDCKNRERVYALALDASGRLINYRMLNEGDIRSSNINLRDLASFLLETSAVSVIISHNHPHGVASPSCDDINVTKTLAELIMLLNVDFHDHIIIGDTTHFSMRNSPRFAHIFYGIDLEGN